MDVLGWIWWLVASTLGLAWTVVWFLLGGWVSTLAQIGVIVLVIFGMKYGWRRAPQELASRASAFGRFGWAWLRSGAPPQPAAPSVLADLRPRPRPASRRQPGDVRINVSTMLSLLMILGLWALTGLKP